MNFVALRFIFERTKRKKGVGYPDAIFFQRFSFRSNKIYLRTEVFSCAPIFFYCPFGITRGNIIVTWHRFSGYFFFHRNAITDVIFYENLIRIFFKVCTVRTTAPSRRRGNAADSNNNGRNNIDNTGSNYCNNRGIKL